MTKKCDIYDKSMFLKLFAKIQKSVRAFVIFMFSSESIYHNELTPHA